MQRAVLPRLSIMRLLRMGRASILPTSRPPPIRLTPSSARGFKTYPPLRNSSTSPDPNALPENASVTSKLKLLIKSYGWYALGVYFALGLVDFSIAFAAIHLFGAEKVGKATAYIKGAVADVWHGTRPEDSPDDSPVAHSHVGSGSLWAMVVLAYTVHKTLFLPLRAGLTVAITPRFVRWLNTRGWAGSAGAMRAANHMRDRMKRKVERE